jgi:hypothetical protein
MVRYADTIVQFWHYKIERYGATCNNSTRVALPLPAETPLTKNPAPGTLNKRRPNSPIPSVANAHLKNYLGINLLMMFPELAKRKIS